MTQSETHSIAFHDLTLGYDRHPAVHHLGTQVARGELTAIVGPNGAGKSTLLKAIAGLLKPMDGRVSVPDDARIAYLPQQSEVDRSFPLRVADLVAMGLWEQTGAFGKLDAQALSRVDEALHAVGLGRFAKRSISALSGGEMQRVLFARLILQDADIILLDEPFAAVDARTTADLMALIAKWHGDGRTVMAVLHDHDMVREHFPTTLMLARELVSHGPTHKVLTLENRARARGLTEMGRHDHGRGELCERNVA